MANINERLTRVETLLETLREFVEVKFNKTDKNIEDIRKILSNGLTHRMMVVEEYIKDSKKLALDKKHNERDWWKWIIRTMTALSYTALLSLLIERLF